MPGIIQGNGNRKTKNERAFILKVLTFYVRKDTEKESKDNPNGWRVSSSLAIAWRNS